MYVGIRNVYTPNIVYFNLIHESNQVHQVHQTPGPRPIDGVFSQLKKKTVKEKNATIYWTIYESIAALRLMGQDTHTREGSILNDATLYKSLISKKPPYLYQQTYPL